MFFSFINSPILFVNRFIFIFNESFSCSNLVSVSAQSIKIFDKKQSEANLVFFSTIQ
jgi:hypothetical protein